MEMFGTGTKKTLAMVSLGDSWKKAANSPLRALAVSAAGKGCSARAMARSDWWILLPTASVGPA
jgi:hypothetical protein